MLTAHRFAAVLSRQLNAQTSALLPSITSVSSVCPSSLHHLCGSIGRESHCAAFSSDTQQGMNPAARLLHVCLNVCRCVLKCKVQDCCLHMSIAKREEFTDTAASNMHPASQLTGKSAWPIVTSDSAIGQSRHHWPQQLRSFHAGSPHQAEPPASGSRPAAGSHDDTAATTPASTTSEAGAGAATAASSSSSSGPGLPTPPQQAAIQSPLQFMPETAVKPPKLRRRKLRSIEAEDRGIKEGVCHIHNLRIGWKKLDLVTKVRC